MVGVRSWTHLSYVIYLLRWGCGLTSPILRDMAKSLRLILGLSQCLNHHGSPGEGLRESCAESIGTLLMFDSEGRWQPLCISHISISWSWKPPLSHSSPHHGWYYLIVLFLSQQKAFYLFTYLFYLFFKLRQGGGWDIPVKSKCVRRGWAGLVRGIFSYI